MAEWVTPGLYLGRSELKSPFRTPVAWVKLLMVFLSTSVSNQATTASLHTNDPAIWRDKIRVADRIVK
jgi:hypothetical protein